jgi:DNA-binding transcriptional LysR family regulator
VLEPVTLDQLRILIAIAEGGSFSAAARRLRRAQSAISHAVVALETALGVGLFDRQGRLPQLTEAGRSLLADARAVVLRADEMRARAQSMTEGIESELSLAVDPMFPRDLLIESVRALQIKFPLLPLTVQTETLGTVEARVRDGVARLGISPSDERLPNADLERRFLSEFTLVSVVAADHPLARHHGPIPLSELERHVQLVLSERDWLVARAQGRPVTSVMRGVISPHVWRFADLATRYDFLRAGFGFCNMPLHMVGRDIEAGSLKRIEFEGWGKPAYNVPLYLILKRGREPGPAACWLIRDMEQRFKAAQVGPAPAEPGQAAAQQIAE